MKFQFIKAPLILTSLFTVALTGCLKDSEFDTGQTQAFVGSKTQVISLGLNVQSSNNQANLAYSNSNNDTTVQLVPVELGGPNNAGSDIHVTLEVDSTLVDALNAGNDSTGNGPSDFAMPAVTFSTLVVTIPKGSRTGWLPASFVPSALIGGDWAIGFRIVSVQEAGYTISGNFNTGIVTLLIKNLYDGQYSMDLETTGWGGFSIADGVTFTWPNNVIFASTGANSNVFTTSQFGTLQPAFTPNGGTNAFGATEPQFTFDATSNLLTGVTNLVPNDGRNRQFSLNPAITTSRFDPSTKTIYLAYLMTQNGRPTQYIYDTLTYVGPR